MYSLLAAKTAGLQAEALEFAQALIRTPSPSLQESDVRAWWSNACGPWVTTGC